MKKVLLHIILFVLPILGIAQDMHFSQYLNTPLYTNPALAGQDQYRVRSSFAYRNQWASVTVPFVTQSAFVDARITSDKIKKDWIGAGLAVYNDVAGDGQLKTSNAYLVGAYTKSFNRMQTAFGGVGFSGGFGNRSLNTSDLFFESQWTGYQFDQNENSFENFNNQSYFYWDLNAGLFFKVIQGRKFEFHFGASFNHVNRPYEKFMDSETRMSMKTIVHGGLTIKAGEGFYFKPDVLFTYRNQAKELLYGGLLVFQKGGSYIYLGGWARTDLDLIPAAGVFIGGFRIMGSYDINLSPLAFASHKKGGFEITITKSFGFLGDSMGSRFRDQSGVPKFSSY
jgi:type IX secretion system PorP/SprF family membrane protein